MRKIVIILTIMVLLFGYNIPVRFEGVHGQGVYTLEVYNVLDIKLYNYVIE